MATARRFPRAARRALVHPARLLLLAVILATALAPVLTLDARSGPALLGGSAAIPALAPVAGPAVPVPAAGAEAAAAGLSSGHAAAVAAATRYSSQQTSYAWVPRTWLPGHLFVLYYGNPLAPVMGVLGQGSSAQMLARLQRQAAAYAAYAPSAKVKVQPGLDLIASVAQGRPQPDHTYRLRMPTSLIDAEVALAEQHRMPLFLDVQVGQSTVPAEVRALAPYLKLPFVELALDPEFDMPAGEVPGVFIGTMSAASVNWAMRYLSALVAEYHLPQKVLIVHEFTRTMLPQWAQIKRQPGVALVFDMDGFGGQSIKKVHYRLYVRDENLPFRYGGIKLFYTQDTGLLTPAEVMQLQPTPSVVMYQ